MTYRYEVTENNEVKVYSNTQEEPIIFQPHWPTGQPFTTEEAEAWGAAKVAGFDETVEYDAGSSPDMPLVRKPTPEEIRLWKLQSLGITVEDLKILLGLPLE